LIQQLEDLEFELAIETLNGLLDSF